MPHRAIGVFDSGLGGLSILREIYRQMPHERLIYVADSAYAPYGDKSADTILQRCEIITRFFLTQNIKAMVIACNTATAIAANYLRQRYPELHIIAIEPAVKPATKLTQNACIGVFATQQTIQSQRLHQLIEQNASHVRVVKQACSGLVEMVEQGRFADAEVRDLLQRYLQPIHQANADVLVLGCTHYPFLHNTIQQLSPQLRIIEPSAAVTRQLNHRLQDQALQALPQKLPQAKSQAKLSTSTSIASTQTHSTQAHHPKNHPNVTFYTSKQQSITAQYVILQHLWQAQTSSNSTNLSATSGKSTQPTIILHALPDTFC